MAYLLDTGILLRLVSTQDELHGDVSACVKGLTDASELLYTTNQNVSEFWNVATRPPHVNGLGMEPPEVLDALMMIVEGACEVIEEPPRVYREFKRLAAAYAFRGKQTHDARLVAQMLAWGLRRILTLNPRDFRRYEAEGIEVFTPQELIDA